MSLTQQKIYIRLSHIPLDPLLGNAVEGTRTRGFEDFENNCGGCHAILFGYIYFPSRGTDNPEFWTSKRNRCRLRLLQMISNVMSTQESIRLLPAP